MEHFWCARCGEKWQVLDGGVSWNKKRLCVYCALLLADIYIGARKENPYKTVEQVVKMVIESEIGEGDISTIMEQLKQCGV